MSTPRTFREVVWLLGALVAFVAGALALSPNGRTSQGSVAVVQPQIGPQGAATTPATAATKTSPPDPNSDPSQEAATGQPDPTAPNPAATATTSASASTSASTATDTAASNDAPSPALSSQSGEGKWHVFASTSSGPVIWATAVHPLNTQPGVIASYALFDPARVHAALFNGTDLPGGGPWNNGSTVMDAARPALIGAFNGGFRFKHIKGGYFAESRTVKPLINGDATLAIGADGRIVLGKYGRDLTNDGKWVSLRQNLPPVIDGGKEAVSTATEQGASAIYWGDDFGHVLQDRRSALCRRRDGMLMYVVTERVDIAGLAQVLLAAQCEFAMELDINGTWPQFVSFASSASGPGTPTALTPAMKHLDRVITGSTKDFVALFDPALLPTNVTK